MHDDLTKTDGDRNVVRFLNKRGTDEDAGIAAFVRYWKKMRRADGLPHRSDIDPRGISPLISNAFIAERIAPGLARMRIAGTHLSDLLGMEVRGMPLSAFFQTDHRDALADDLVRVFDEPAMLRMTLRAEPARGSALEGTMILLPLRSDLGDVSRALGCLVTRGAMGTAPHRFVTLRSTITPIRLTGQPAVVPGAAAPLQGFGEDQSPLDAPLRPGERPYLRVVK